MVGSGARVTGVDRPGLESKRPGADQDAVERQQGVSAREAPRAGDRREGVWRQTSPSKGPWPPLVQIAHQDDCVGGGRVLDARAQPCDLLRALGAGEPEVRDERTK